MAGSLRLRVFAGPNGSGKSSVYEQVKGTVVGKRPVDVGTYVNADDIAGRLRHEAKLDLGEYGVEAGASVLHKFAVASGLLNGTFTHHRFKGGHRLDGNVLVLRSIEHVDHFAQLLAAFLCDRLLKARKKFSFETVFSHPSKVEFMERAAKAGYKVYLYYVATNSPEINIDRVRTRVGSGGHDVPHAKVKDRYHRSLRQLLRGIEVSYHAFVFDNSGDRPVMFGEMKKVPAGTSWAWFGGHADVPDWFVRHFLIASGDPGYLYLAKETLDARAKGTPP